jgi:hypothetical protein
VTRDVGRTPEPPVLMALSALLGLWNLSVNGWANTYYSGAMRAMSTSWHDFLFASLDKSGLMTLDKPPLGLWVQALSVRVFGPHPLSVLAPQVLTGVVATALLYDLTRRRFGRLAGFVAGLALATTPVIVAVSRHNNPDELLVLCSVAALWCFVAALERGVTKCLVLSAVCVGLGFETKMLVAFMIVPGMAVAWCGQPRSRWPRACGADLRAAIAYAKAHGAGTIGVESQSSAASAILTANAARGRSRRVLGPGERGEPQHVVVVVELGRVGARVAVRIGGLHGRAV